jgi:hypothetical protein
MCNKLVDELVLLCGHNLTYAHITQEINSNPEHEPGCKYFENKEWQNMWNLRFSRRWRRMSMWGFWVVMSCGQRDYMTLYPRGLQSWKQRLGVTYYLHLQPWTREQHVPHNVAIHLQVRMASLTRRPTSTSSPSERRITLRESAGNTRT